MAVVILLLFAHVVNIVVDKVIITIFNVRFLHNLLCTITKV